MISSVNSFNLVQVISEFIIADHEWDIPKLGCQSTGVEQEAAANVKTKDYQPSHPTHYHY